MLFSVCVDGRINDDALVQEIDQEIREVKQIENERVSYAFT